MGSYVESSGGGGGSTSPATEDVAGVVKLSTADLAAEGLDDATAMTPLKTKQVVSDSIGKVVQLGFNGVLQDKVLMFTRADSEEPYEIKTGYEYEVDLLFEAVGDLDESYEMIIVNDGVAYNIMNAMHDDPETLVSVGDMKQLMKYSTDIGFRWVFNARAAETTDSKKAFVMASTIVNLTDIEDQIGDIGKVLDEINGEVV